MIKVEICNEYGITLFYRDEDDSVLDNPIDVINEDKHANNLVNEITELYTSFFDSSINRDGFDYKKEKRSIGKMLELATKLEDRLNQINDGSYVVINYISKQLKREYPLRYRKAMKDVKVDRKIIIDSDLSNGPLWCYDEYGILQDEPFDIVANDKVAMDLANELDDLYLSFFDFSSNEKFNSKMAENHLDKMLDLVAKLKNRLDEINDGSYVVVDVETNELVKIFKDKQE